MFVMVRVFLFGFCDCFYGFFRVVSGFKHKSAFTPLLNFLEGVDVDFMVSGLFFNPLLNDSGFIESMFRGDELRFDDFFVEPFSRDSLRGVAVEDGVAVIHFDSFSLDDLNFILNFLLDHSFNVILLGGDRGLLERFTRFFDSRGRIFVGGDLLGYLDDLSLVYLLLHFLDLMGLDVSEGNLVRFSDFKSVKFCNSDMNYAKSPILNKLNITPIQRRVKKGYMLSKFFTEFVFLGSEFSFSLNCLGDRFLSWGSKLFDLILAVHCYSKIGAKGAPSDLKVYGFSNYLDGKISYIDALKSVFDNVKRCFFDV